MLIKLAIAIFSLAINNIPTDNHLKYMKIRGPLLAHGHQIKDLINIESSMLINLQKAIPLFFTNVFMISIFL